MKRIALSVVICTFFSSACWAGGGIPSGDVASIIESYDAIIGNVRVPVQKVLHPRALTAVEFAVIDAYMAAHPGLVGVNIAATRNALELLVGIGQSHIPLTRTPAMYMADYQTVTQLLKYLELYVNCKVWTVPPPCPIVPPEPIKPVVLEKICWEHIEINLLPVAGEPIKLGCAPKTSSAGVAIFGSPATQSSNVIGAVSLVTERNCKQSKDDPGPTCPVGGVDDNPGGPIAAGKLTPAGSGN